MAEIPETIDYGQAREIQSDTNHPLHGEFRAGNPALIEKIARAYRNHHSGAKPAGSNKTFAAIARAEGGKGKR